MGFYRGVRENTSGTFSSRYGSVHIGTFETLHDAALAYNIALRYSFCLKGYSRWAHEFENPTKVGIPPPKISSSVFSALKNKRLHSQALKRPLYDDFWEISHPVHVSTGLDKNCFIVVQESDACPTCVTCSGPVKKRRGASWKSAPVSFFKCDVCLFRQE